MAKKIKADKKSPLTKIDAEKEYADIIAASADDTNSVLDFFDEFPVAQIAETTETIEVAETSAPQKNRGRKPKNAAPSDEVAETSAPPKNRGRKPKKAAPSDEVAEKPRKAAKKTAGNPNANLFESQRVKDFFSQTRELSEKDDMPDINTADIIKSSENLKCKLLPVPGLVVFPGASVHFDLVDATLMEIVEKSFKKDSGKLFVTLHYHNFTHNSPTEGALLKFGADICKVGTIIDIKQMIKAGDKIMRVLATGTYAATIAEEKMSFAAGDEVSVEVFEGPTVREHREILKRAEDPENSAMMRSIKGVFSKLCKFVLRMPEDYVNTVLSENDPFELFALIAFNVPLEPRVSQVFLEEFDIYRRLTALYAALAKELDVVILEHHIQEQTASNINEDQHKYFLREQLRTIADELGENIKITYGNGVSEFYGGEGENSESDDEVMRAVGDDEETDMYYLKIISLGLEIEHQNKLMSELKQLKRMSPHHPDAATIRSYLDTVIELPWNEYSKTKTDLEKCEKALDRDHYGLKKVKERVVESLAVYSLKPDVTGQIICLAGPPGTGKTSVGKSIAKGMGRKYVRVSLGGVRDEAEIRGHRKTYLGSMPGRIIAAMKQAGTMNPLILLDEIDKLGNDYKGDPASAMLEVLDPEQNKTFRDHFLEIPFDLSRVLFITTANDTSNIPRPLLDRMEIIELTSYTREEKFNIAKKHLIPKQIKKNGLKPVQVKIEDDAVYELIDGYTKEAGVRGLEKQIASLCRKTAKEIVKSGVKKTAFTAQNLEDYLGARKFPPEELNKENEVGVTNGLAYTSVGGTLLPLEVVVTSGKGNIKLTGSLGDVMKESAQLAVTYARTVAEQYDIAEDFYRKKDIHIHAPEGAVPKDGPSAGVTMVTSLISALSGIPVRADVAMTGEITLHGKVLPIGGLREKTMAAYKNNIKTIIIPEANRGDLYDVEEVVKANVDFKFANKISDVLDIALTQINNV